MDFTDKFIRYHPDITFEIFQLIWDKLHSIGWRHMVGQDIQNSFKLFSKGNAISQSTFTNEFYLYSTPDKTNTEITVEEFLGYNPFTKSTEIDWSKVSDETLLTEAKLRYPEGTKFKSALKNCPNPYQGIIKDKIHIGIIEGERIVWNGDEIGFLYDSGKWAEIISLPESKPIDKPIESKEEYPEYYEFIGENSISEFIKGKIYKINSPTSLEAEGNFIDEKGEKNGYSGLNYKYFKPSTKEAFDLQNRPKQIESKMKYKFKVGDKVKIVQYGLGCNHNSLGEIVTILELGEYFGNPGYKTTPVLKGSSNANTGQCNYMIGERSFELYKESLKQAVHCKTQEEWNFVLSKFNPRGLSKDIWSRNYTENTCITYQYKDDSNHGTYGSLDWYKKENYQILSFQEWCDLNGYKMEKEVKFEVGKWYKVLNNWWAKFETIHNSGKRIKFSEVITNSGEYRNEGTHIDFISELQLLTDLSEIQQYLPDGHPDKVVKSIEVKVGDWVLGPDKVIAKITKIDFEFLYTTNKYHKYGLSDGSDTSWIDIKHNNFRLATPEEIKSVQPIQSSEFVLPEKWCIKHDKFVGKWFDDNIYNVGHKNSKYEYLYYIPYNGSRVWNDIKENYTEITLDQFKKYVLKEEKVMENEFKIGDYVELIANKTRSCNSIGDIGIVEEISDTDSCRVKCQTTTHSGNWSTKSDLKLSSLEAYNKKYGISNSKNDLLEEAKRRYPIGTNFISPHNNLPYKVHSKHKLWCNHTKDNILILISENVGDYVYFNGKWAEIIEEPDSKSNYKINDCPFNERDLVSCYIKGQYTEGQIHFENESIYICQNKWDGAACGNKLGYKYSWGIFYSDNYSSFDDQLNQNRVADLKLLNESKSSDPLDDEYNEIFSSKGIVEQIKSKPMVVKSKSIKSKPIEHTWVYGKPIKTETPKIELLKTTRI